MLVEVFLCFIMPLMYLDVNLSRKHSYSITSTVFNWLPRCCWWREENQSNCWTRTSKVITHSNILCKMKCSPFLIPATA